MAIRFDHKTSWQISPEREWSYPLRGRSIPDQGAEGPEIFPGPRAIAGATAFRIFRFKARRSRRSHDMPAVTAALTIRFAWWVSAAARWAPGLWTAGFG